MYLNLQLRNLITSLPVNKVDYFETTPSNEYFCFSKALFEYEGC